MIIMSMNECDVFYLVEINYLHKYHILNGNMLDNKKLNP